jgi:hypothetical protein
LNLKSRRRRVVTAIPSSHWRGPEGLPSKTFS